VLILHLAVKKIENRSIFCEAIDFRAKHPLFWPTLYVLYQIVLFPVTLSDLNNLISTFCRLSYLRS